MKPTPKGWPRISTGIYYEDPAAAIDFICRAFGFEVRLKVEGEGGRIEHSELTFGEGLVMVGAVEGKRDFHTSPKRTGGKVTQTMCIFVDDVDKHAERAKAAGAKIAIEPVTNDYGDDYWSDRSYLAEDLEGHKWWFMQRVRDGKN